MKFTHLCVFDEIHKRLFSLHIAYGLVGMTNNALAEFTGLQ